MTLFENPFYILGASMTDDRQRLRSLHDEKSLLNAASCDEAFQTLITPSRRLMVELCWFPGCDETEVLSALSSLEDAKRKGVATLGNISRLRSPVACIGELNLLLSLLSYAANSDIDNFLFEACRLFDAIDLEQLRTVINEDREKSGMPAVTRISDFEDSLLSYQNDVCSTLVKRLQEADPYDYDHAVYRVASFGTSPIIDAVMRNYEYLISSRLDQYEIAVQNNIKELERFFNKEDRPALIEKIQKMVSGWDGAIEPLRKYCEAVGTDVAIRDHEKKMISDILCRGYDSLANQGPDTEHIRLSIARIIMQITPEKEKYRNLRALLLLHISAMEMAEFKRQQEAAERYRSLAEEAWQNEQKRNDAENRKRSEEAAAQDRARIVKSEESEIASYKARYKKIKEDEEFAAKEVKRKREAENIARKAQERERKIISLETEQKMLKTELSNLKGLFSGKRRKQLEARISEINLELSKINKGTY